MRRQNGVALLLVLWALGLLSVLLGGLAGWVQLETRQAQWQRQHTQALLAAEAGVNLAIQGLLESRGQGAGRSHWIADGRVMPLRFDNAQLAVSVRSERGKLDLNAAINEDVLRVVQACGASRSQATQIAQGVQTRRTGNQPPLRVLEEFRQLVGMTQPLNDCLVPQVTLWSGLERPEAAFATPLLRKALNMPTQATMSADPGEVLSLESEAQLPNGFTARLYTTVLLNPSEGQAQPYRVLRWQE